MTEDLGVVICTLRFTLFSPSWADGSVVFLSDVLSDLKLLSSHSSLTFTQLLTAVTLLLLWQRGCVLMDAVLTSSSNIHSNVQPASSSVPDCVINKLRMIFSHRFVCLFTIYVTYCWTIIVICTVQICSRLNTLLIKVIEFRTAVLLIYYSFSFFTYFNISRIFQKNNPITTV